MPSKQSLKLHDFKNCLSLMFSRQWLGLVVRVRIGTWGLWLKSGLVGLLAQ